MIRKFFLSLFSCSVLVPFFTGCQQTTAYQKVGTRPAKMGKVAVIPFENETESAEAGTVLAEALFTELEAAGGMDLVPQHLVKKDLAAELARRDTPRDYRKLGEKVGATVVVSGVVSEYRYRRSLGESPVIGFTINFINARTGEIFWGASTHDEGVRILTYRGSLSELSQKLARRIVRQFNSKL